MKTKLALYGGNPVRDSVLPYGRQTIGEDDIEAVANVLRSDWLTTGPQIPVFEKAFAEFTGAKEAVAVNSGTAALHAAMFGLNIGIGDEVIVTPMTFAASANAAVYLGAVPVFADVDPDTLLIDPGTIESKITSKTKAIVAVDYAGQPCDYNVLYEIANKHDLRIIDDACHAIGGSYRGKPVGTLADVNTFSLHPVKHMTTGEGGVITTESPELAHKMRTFRNHGITTDHRQRDQAGSWFYEMVALGFNYRVTDFQCALGLSQLAKLRNWVVRRQQIATQYDSAFAEIDGVTPLVVRDGVSHGYHLYVVRFDMARLGVDKPTLFSMLRAENIGVQVHYIPVHLHPYYQQNFGTYKGQCPVAEAAYQQVVSLPIFPMMTDDDLQDVINAILKIMHS